MELIEDEHVVVGEWIVKLSRELVSLGRVYDLRFLRDATFQGMREADRIAYIFVPGFRAERGELARGESTGTEYGDPKSLAINESGSGRCLSRPCFRDEQNLPRVVGAVNDLSLVLVNRQLLRSLLLFERRLRGAPPSRGSETVENCGEIVAWVEGVVLGKRVLRGAGRCEEFLIGLRGPEPYLLIKAGSSTFEIAHRHLRKHTT
jgi:hypothetical protein